VRTAPNRGPSRWVVALAAPLAAAVTLYPNAPHVIVKFTGPGFGTIHAQISGPTGETDTDDNGGALSVQVVK
jgi:hypothetical protein